MEACVSLSLACLGGFQMPHCDELEMLDDGVDILVAASVLLDLVESVNTGATFAVATRRTAEVFSDGFEACGLSSYTSTAPSLLALQPIVEVQERKEELKDEKYAFHGILNFQRLAISIDFHLSCSPSYVVRPIALVLKRTKSK